MTAPENSSVTPGSAPRPPPEPSSIVVVIGGAIDRAHIPGLCEHVRGLLEGSDAESVVCDVGALVDPDAVAVDALARLQLTALRLGRRVRLRHARRELTELLAFMGLSDACPLYVEPRGQAEQREQARGVEEEVGPDDPTV